jgi:hypothetical protein
VIRLPSGPTHPRRLGPFSTSRGDCPASRIDFSIILATSDGNFFFLLWRYMGKTRAVQPPMTHQIAHKADQTFRARVCLNNDRLKLFCLINLNWVVGFWSDQCSQSRVWARHGFGMSRPLRSSCLQQLSTRNENRQRCRIFQFVKRLMSDK